MPISNWTFDEVLEAIQAPGVQHLDRITAAYCDLDLAHAESLPPEAVESLAGACIDAPELIPVGGSGRVWFIAREPAPPPRNPPRYPLP